MPVVQIEVDPDMHPPVGAVGYEADTASMDRGVCVRNVFCAILELTMVLFGYLSLFWQLYHNVPTCVLLCCRGLHTLDIQTDFCSGSLFFFYADRFNELLFGVVRQEHP